MTIWIQLGNEIIMVESKEEKFMGSVALNLVDLQVMTQEAEVALIVGEVVKLGQKHQHIETAAEEKDLFHLIQEVGVEDPKTLILENLHRLEVEDLIHKAKPMIREKVVTRKIMKEM